MGLVNAGCIGVVLTIMGAMGAIQAAIAAGAVRSSAIGGQGRSDIGSSKSCNCRLGS